VYNLNKNNRALNSAYWNSVAERIIRYPLEQNIAEYKREEHIKLIEKWVGSLRNKTVLKTDLFEEALGQDHFLFWMLNQTHQVYGMDISFNITKRAKDRTKQLNCKSNKFVVCDVRMPSFKNESFDLVVSNSTLDNIYKNDVSGALFELRRILKPKGILILTLDNKHNPLYLMGYLIEKILNTNKYYLSKCYTLKETLNLVRQHNFIVQEFTFLVHIPTPFNKLALFLTKINKGLFDKLIKYFIRIFSKLGSKKTKFLTGWFLALKLEKG